MTDDIHAPVLSKEDESLTNLSTAVYPTPQQGSAETDMEQELQQEAALRLIGVCFSGGGSRALSAAMGQYRGLMNKRDKNGVPYIDRVGTISSVSGGTWASSIYIYLPKEFTYDELIGGVAQPSELRWKGSGPAALDYLHTNSMGQVPGRVGISEIVEQIVELHHAGFKDWSQMWRAAIGRLVLKPFGLYEEDSEFNPTTYYAWQPEWFDKFIGPKNSSLRSSQFHFARNRWPWLTMNTAMFVEENSDYMAPVMSHMFRSGINGTFPQKGQTGPTVGGGCIQPFAFASRYVNTPEAGRANVASPRPFSLSDIVGLSSSAFAEELQENKILKDLGAGSLIPKYDYFPVVNGGSSGGVNKFADGGNLEDTGVGNLLASTSLRKIVIFVNNESKVEQKADFMQISSDIPPLFGYKLRADKKGYEPYNNNDPSKIEVKKYDKVFDGSKFYDLVNGLKAATDGFKNAAIFFQKDLQVEDNSWFGVKGRGKVDVLWVCNNKVTSWEDQLEWEIKAALDVRDVPESPLWNFPWYGTVLQLHLDAPKVNMLAHLSCWVVMADENASEWEKIFD